MAKIQWNKDHTPKSIPVSVYLAAERLGITTTEYLQRYGNPSEYNNITNQPNPKKQWGNMSQHSRKDDDK